MVADLAVIGGGVIGLATAAAASELGLSVALFTADRAGAASRAAAGLLVPHYSGEGASAAVGNFMSAARDMYPAYVASLAERSGTTIPLFSDGAIELAYSDDAYAALDTMAPVDATRLTPAQVAVLEPELAPCAGGVLYQRDGAVDNVRLMDALTSVVDRHRRVRIIRESVTRLDLSAEWPTVTGEAGSRVAADHVVLAAGAWSDSIVGLPRRIPVRPLRGQICTLSGAPLRHVVLGTDVYMVCRGGDRTLVGSTMEDVGFDPSTTDEGISALRQGAAAACPVLGGRSVNGTWSGLRPATPDLLPILGCDPDHPQLVYACGHSRNGILLAPITAMIAAAIAASADVGWDISAFSIERFADAGRR